ncbi:MAG: translation initiation factor IF-2 N-terminal domain-containing protein, partial [Armatimonadetes bacterium]|nr:translation initiation factor IF-2 N-terminal domain-containing protein [Armatimonadota bacterium]
MAKVRIYDIAKELDVSPKEILEMLTSIGVANKVASSSVEDTAARSLRQMIANRNNPQPEPEEAPKEVKPAAPQKFETFQRGNFRARPTEENGGEAASQAPAATETAPPPPRAPQPPVETATPAPAPPAPTPPAPKAPASKGDSNGSAPRPQSPRPAPAQNGSSSAPPAPSSGPAAPPAAPKPPIDRSTIVNPPIVNPVPAGGFAMGARDRRAMKTGRYRGGGGRGDRDNGPRFGDKDFRVQE